MESGDDAVDLAVYSRFFSFGGEGELSLNSKVWESFDESALSSRCGTYRMYGPRSKSARLNG